VNAAVRIDVEATRRTPRANNMFGDIATI